MLKSKKINAWVLVCIFFGAGCQPTQFRVLDEESLIPIPHASFTVLNKNIISFSERRHHYESDTNGCLRIKRGGLSYVTVRKEKYQSATFSVTENRLSGEYLYAPFVREENGVIVVHLQRGEDRE
ncbi:MAG: hypothetical protein LBW77_06640 [Verrucomicrobiota bacterium]|jgi:hypothetical protein|nr:hypothetical protein [Verrucomicrobiota bacterium]